MAAILLLGLSAGDSRLPGATLYWDGANTSDTNDALTGANLGGSGTWNNLLTANWWDGIPSSSALTWNNAGLDTAIFWGSAGTVTLESPLVASGLLFKTSGYLLTGGSLTLAGSSSITAELGTYTTLASQILGTDGLTLAGTSVSGRGAVRLSNAANSYTGTTTISGGTLVISQDSQLGSASNAVVINGVLGAGLPGGTLFLAGNTTAAGYATGITLAASRNVSMTGGGVGYANSIPPNSGSALVSLGNNRIAGLLTTSPTPLGSAATGAVSGFGVLTLSNLSAGGTPVTNFTTLGSTGSIGGYRIDGPLSGTGSLNKTGGGTLILSPTSAANFSGTVRVTAGSVRVSDPLSMGTNAGTGLNSAFDLNGGVFEIRADSFDASTKGLASRAASTLFVDRAVDGSAINGTATFGNFIGNANTTATFNSRNGFNTTFNAVTITPTSNATSLTLTNNGSGLVTFTGNIWGQTTAANTLTVSGTGDILFNTGITATAANTTNHFIKSGAGTLTIAGVGSTIVSPTTVSAGTLAITDFRSLTLASTQVINLGATTTAATLTIGTSVTPTAAGLTTTRVLNLAGTTGGATINANQPGTNPVLINAPVIAATGVGIKTLTLGGSSTVDNTISAAIANAGTAFAQTANSASGATVLTFASTTGIAVGQLVGGTGIAPGTTVTAVTPTTVTLSRGTTAARTTENLDVATGTGAAVTLSKTGAGTWLLSGTNTYTGATNLFDGTLKIRANAAASTVLADASAITFGSNTTTLTAGGRLEFIGVSGAATTENLGALTPTAGAGTIVLTSGGAGAAANLVFASLGATTSASSVNFITTGGGGGGITLTGQLETTATTLPGTTNFLGHLYVNGADFAAINASAQVITPIYGSTTGFVLGGSALTAGLHNWVDQEIASQPTVTVSSLKMTTANLTLAGNLTLSTGALLQTGGSAQIDATSARTILGAAAATNIVIRVNGASDTLTLTSNVTIPSTQTGGLTKNGAGTLVIAGTNAQTGTTNINEGTVRLSGPTARLSGSSVATVLRQGATLDLNGQSTGVAIGAFDGAGTVTNSSSSPGTLVVGNVSTGAGIFSGIIQDGAGVTNVSVTGTTGSPTWSGLNTYTGVTTIGTGLATTAKLVNVNTLANIGTASSLGRGLSTSDATNAASLVFGGLATAGINYTGTTSVSIDRLFTLNAGMAGGGAQIANSSGNNSTLIFNKTHPITFGPGATVAQTLTLGGSSTGDNRINLQITDNGTLPTSLNKIGAGLWILGNDANSYTGTTTIGNTTLAGGVLQAIDGASLPTASYLILGSGTTGGGVLQTVGSFTRNVGTTAAANTVTLGAATATTAAVGFSAGNGKLILAFGGLVNPTALTWGSGGFMGVTGTSTGAFVLNSVYSLDEIEVRNAIDLNGTTRTIQVDDNVSTFTDFATITGVISNGTGTAGLSKTGTGILQLLEANTYNGATSVLAGTLVVNSLGSTSGSGGTSVGLSGTGVNTAAQALILGNAGTTGGILNYIGAGETSDRLIQINTTTGTTQIIADGSGPLILSNLLNSGATGAKTLALRGVSNFANEITSNLNNDSGGGVLSVTRDTAGTWILSGNNGYTGGTSLSSGGFLGVGSDSALGGFGGTPGTLTLTAGTMFAAGGDRTIRNPVTFSGTNTSIAAFVGEYSLTFTGNWGDGTTTSLGRVLRNNIISGKTLTLNGNYTYTSVTSSASGGVTIDGSGDTLINGNISQNTGLTGNTAAGLMGVVYAGTGSLTLGGTGNSYPGNTRILNGTLKLGADNVIPDGSISAAATTTAGSTNSTTVTAPTTNLYPGMTIFGGSAPATIVSITNATTFVASAAQTLGSGTNLTFSLARGNVVLTPAAATTATFDLNGWNETINGLTTTGAGHAVITNSAAGPATLLLGMNNATLDIHSTGGGTTTITNSGGALSIIKIGTAAASIPSGHTLTYTGSTSVTGGSLTIASPLNGTSALSATGAGSNLNLTGLIANPAAIQGVTVSGGAFLSFLDGTGTPIPTLNSLNLGAGSGSATLSLDLGGTSDTLTVLNPATIANTITFNLQAVTGFTDNTVYNLLVAPGGLGTLSNYLLGSQPGGFTAGSLSLIDDTRVIYTSGTAIIGDLYWNNTQASGSWATNLGGLTNFTTNLAGTVEGGYTPGPNTTVIFGSTNTTMLSGSAFSTTLDANFNIAGLQFTANPTGVTTWAIGSGAPATSSLTLRSGGISVGVNAGAVTISAPLVLGTSQTWSVNGSGANGSSLALNGPITGGAGAALAIDNGGGTGITSMNAAAGQNTYSGTTTVSNGGTLQGGATNSFSPNSDFTLNGTGILRLNGFSNSVRSLAGVGGTVDNGNATTAATLTVGSSNASTSFSGALINGGAATLGLTKVGTGTLTLGGTSTYTGITTVLGGSLRITGSINNSPTGAGGATVIGNTAATFGLVEVPTGGNLTTDTLTVGGVNGGAGSLVIRGGSVNTTDTTTTTGINVGTGGYGSLLLSAGSVTANRVSLYNSATGTGVLQVSGGTLTSNEYIILSNLRTEFTVTGGSVLHNAASQNLAIAYNLTGTTVMNLAGGTVDNTGRNVSFGQNGTETPTGILNLGGGTLITNTMTVGSTVNATLNFNGGTLRAVVDSSAFLPSSTRLAAYVNGAFGTFAGGAVIDTNGRNVTIASSLLSPAGSSGVSALSLGGAGSGYIGAPYLEIVRAPGDATGSGATGYATIDTDPSSPTYGQVTSVVLTNPGINYTAAPTVNLIGGLGPTGVAASVTAAGLMANSSGGLTKVGAGTLTLTGANTYSGGTTVQAGTLTVGSGGTLGSTTGTLAVNNPNTGAGSAVILNLATAVDTSVGSLSGTIATPASGSNTATINTQASRQFSVQQTVDGTYAGVIAGSGSLMLGSLSTHTLTLTGTNTYTGTTTVSAGHLQVGRAGTGTTGTGAVTLQAGATLLGTGIVRGSSFTAESGSTLHVGDNTSAGSFGTLNFTPASASGSTSSLQGTLIMGLSGATLTDATYGGNVLGSAGYNAWLDGVTGVGAHDRLAFNNPGTGTGYSLNFLTLTGSLQVVGSDFTPADGQVFNLLDWSNLVNPNFSGFAFSNGYLRGDGDEGDDLDLPDISSSGLLWDFSRFTTSGNIAIIAIPEPSRALLLFGGLLGWFLRRRQR